MPDGSVNSFACPRCHAPFQVVKVDAGPETTDREISCPICRGPLVGREGKLVLKYFLASENIRSANGQCRMTVT
jgi:hypothetical protein